MKRRDYGTHAGTGPFEGMYWNGKEWIGEPTEAALAERAKQPWVAGRYASTTDDIVARRLSAVVYAVLAVLCAVVASSAVQLFGTSLGALIALGALAVAAVLAIIAFAKL